VSSNSDNYTMSTELTIISVSYNSAALFLSNWKEFLENTLFKVIIVDNASSDGSGQSLLQAFPNHHILQLENNIGYGRAANEGLKLCESRFALLLNPDLIISKEKVSQLLSLAIDDQDNTAIWAPVLKRDAVTSSRPVSTEAVSGAAMLFDLHKMAHVGFFDENIFLYSEETDLCYRTRQKGYVIKLCPELLIDHLGDSSSGGNQSLIFMKSYHFGWSRCYYLDKHSLCSDKYNPLRMYRNYRLKAYISLSSENRLRYKGQAAGVKAFMDGQKAFRGDGSPQASPI
jgi:N-acetylglucosaminyl-diphospho-decaprenol L-rhamnosyltransferase